MDRNTWTDNRDLWWKEYDTSTWGFTNVEVTIKSTPPGPVYRNGQKLKPGQSRPRPFWVNPVGQSVPFYNEPMTNSITKFVIGFRLCGAYSRKFDKVRKFRKERLF